MSVRQRVPFRFSENGDENARILDEQEQEELLEQLKRKSDENNSQYSFFIRIVIALSSTLHILYLLKSPESKKPPIAVLFPNYTPPDGFRPITGHLFFTTLNLFIHANLSVHLAHPTHHVREWLARGDYHQYTSFLPLPFSVLFALSAPAPLMSFIVSNGWHDVVWWGETAAMVWFVSSAHRWMGEETESLRNLERLRYDARGA
ncbi:hypothetical protein BXZ70DRAFT_615670 [Cristinia sonorae]|uniref:Uncharacterized protein n=1 Tax=Cristinia sonorae TaxID=1940300 RepID=A0A8K0XSZ2_9AGAR|nr:hypothetical protein BXZ70DRAFT_615670 [Cristinia sonorae]